MIKERWLPVLGYEGHYEASDLGRIRSLDRVIRQGGRQVFRRGCIIQQRPRSDGRLTVTLRLHGTSMELRVHRLVLEAFVGPRPEGLEACHNNGNELDNRLANLRWDTHSSNMQDQLRHGTHAQARKTHCPAGHPYSDENTTASRTRGRMQRRCLTCLRIRGAQRRQAERAA